MRATVNIITFACLNCLAVGLRPGAPSGSCPRTSTCTGTHITSSNGGNNWSHSYSDSCTYATTGASS